MAMVGGGEGEWIEDGRLSSARGKEKTKNTP